jgi:hypothetical protein
MPGLFYHCALNDRIITIHYLQYGRDYSANENRNPKSPFPQYQFFASHIKSTAQCAVLWAFTSNGATLTSSNFPFLLLYDML